MRAIALLCALCAFAGTLAAITTSRAKAAKSTPNAALLVELDRYRQATWHWQRLMGVRPTRSTFSPLRSPDPAYRRWVLRLWQQRSARLERQASRWMARRVRSYRAQVSHWQQVMGVAPVRETAAVAGREATFLRWRAIARRVVRQAQHPPYESAWNCIHRYEGSWTDAGSPYYGGLQMDLDFQQRYGGYLLNLKGTAEHWTPVEQMWVAARAHRSGRGFYPWPATARACGLI